MKNIYECGYDLRVGYTEGFNDGLTGKANAHELPETEWNSADRLDAKKSPYFVQELIPMATDHANDEISGYYKTGYNWGWMHGQGEREKLKNDISEEQFEKSMGDFANCLKIFHLQLRREYYLVGVTSLEPEAEKASRIKFMDQFVRKPGGIIPDKAILQEIKTSLSESNVQRAIDKSVDYFSDQKDLGNFSYSLSLKSKLMDLREDSRERRIEKDEYLMELRKLGDFLQKLIEDCLQKSS